ncbi:MAG: M61 family metallopeptidase [Ignavibacteriae bacterium]|nr:M61 family metallopeptidase [Ignavibacteriota bacterium]MCB9243688.1 M61 family metallopeptidase [Ignavibacteriales bacterium]
MSKIEYKISFPNPVTHYCDVEITTSTDGAEEMEFEMPVWTPGSYKVRDYARHVDKIKASANSKELDCEKTGKSSWEINTSGVGDVKLTYRVYCNELTVRTSEITSDHAYLNGTSVFMYIKGRIGDECELEIQPYHDWKKISTGLKKIGDSRFSAENYDILADCPIEIGNQQILEFEVDEKKHYICIYGAGNYDAEKFVVDFEKIVEAESKMMEGLPYKNFTFLITIAEGVGGGLEHLNSFSAMYPPWVFDDEKRYKKFLGLISHELFHVWNVKRVRPLELGPFDYSKEVYTKMHWVTEGWTSFFDNLTLKRADILDDKEYLEFVAEEVNEVLKYTGRFQQSLEDSSYYNWTKFYNRHENSRNDQISYYKKGGLIALMLDIEIITTSNCEKSLDDVLRILFEDYNNDPGKGYTGDRVKEVIESLTGKNMDEFWNKYIRGTDEIPFAEYLLRAGVELKDKNKEGEIKLNAVINRKSDNVILDEVYDGGSAYGVGLSAGDELIALNGIRVTNNNFKAVLNTYKPGDETEVVYSRAGKVRDLKMKILEQVPTYELVKIENPDDMQKKVWEKWISG